MSQFLGPLLQDKSVWATVCLWGLTALNAKLGLGLNHDTLMAVSSAVSACVAAHLFHANTVGKKEDPA